MAGILALSAAALLPSGSPAGEPSASTATVPIIFDTDIGTDVDDAGALAILHVLADRGEARILATISANGNRWCAPALDVINTYCDFAASRKNLGICGGGRGAGDQLFRETASFWSVSR
jgi:hypothetical protein